MPADVADTLKLDTKTLTPLVRAILDHGAAEVMNWEVIPIVQGRASPAAVYRIAGNAQTKDGVLPWSLVLKESNPPTASTVGDKPSNDPKSWWYWKRELLLYQSGLFAELPEGFVTPQVYCIEDEPEFNRIWMEDVREDVGAIWPLQHYGHVAQHFGRFNGLYLAQRPIPPWPWLMPDLIAFRVGKAEWADFAHHYPTLRETNLLVQRGWTDDLFAAFDRIWHEREHFLQVLANLPQTLLHNDAGRKNLFARRHPAASFETVVLDWGATGMGAIGEDLATIVAQPVWWFNGVRPEELPELDAIAFPAYVQGLRDVGWQGNPALARLGYTLHMVLHHGLAIFWMEWAARNENTRIWIETTIGHPMEEIADVMRSLRSYVVARADEARSLIASQESFLKLGEVGQAVERADVES
jgi:hypothetical protein